MRRDEREPRRGRWFDSVLMRTVTSGGRPRVFIGLSEVAGQFSSIEAALRASGINAAFHNLSPDVFRYRGGKSWSVGRLRDLRGSRQGTLGHRLWRVALRINGMIRRARAAGLFPIAVLRYDAFILGGHETFLGGIDLWILRRLRKPVVIIFTGSDHRPPFLSGKGIRLHGDQQSLIRASKRLSRRVRRAERWAAAVVALPTSAQFHRRAFIHFLAIGIPMMSHPHGPQARSGVSHAVRVLHCPTDPVGKGSDRIRTAIDRVRDRGIAIDYREVVGRPNDEVLRAIEWCDFVVDELYSDTPMAKFGTEAAHFSKPAVVGSYAVDAYRHDGPGPIPPSQLCHPDAVEDAIYELATDPVRRMQLGADARTFVTNEWAPARVAEKLMTLISGSAPSEWIVRTEDVGYVHGWGMPEPALVRTLFDLLRVATPKDLGIPPGTLVEANLRKLAEQGGPIDHGGSRDP